MRYSHYCAFLIGSSLVSSALQAATINTIPLQTNGTAPVQTPITSSSHSISTTPAATQDNSQPSQEAQLAAWMIEAAQAAKNYVDLLDKNQFAQTWSQGDAVFQRTITQAEWVKALDLARKKLGAVQTRTVKDQRPAFNPKGLPPGPYMVVEYNTSFDKAPNSGELLTLRLGPDGNWRVLTYQVN
jgi:Protein of unknown function (DUF4019)